MKTSDKLLLAFALASIAIFGILHLTLYAEYKKGNILDAQDIHNEQYSKFSMPAPQFLSLKGTVWVNLIPSDSFYIEFPKNPIQKADGYFAAGKKSDRKGAGDKPLYFTRQGDTIVIFGQYDQPLRRPFADFSYQAIVPQVNVHCRSLREIRLFEGQAVLRGVDNPSLAVTGRVVVVNSTLWLGDWQGAWPYPRVGEASRPEPKTVLDSLDIESVNSIVLMNSTAEVRHLQVKLQDHSELNDQGIILGRLEIGYSSDSRVNLTGDNLKKTQKILAE